MTNTDNILDILNEMQTMQDEFKSSGVKGDEFGLFDYNDEDPEKYQ